MGEVIRTAGSIDIGSEQFRVELNQSPADPAKREVHIQNDTLRLAVNEEDFCRMAAGVLLARKQLHQIKGTGK